MHPALQFLASSQVSVPHLAYHPVSMQYSLPPFVLSQALPQVFGYYGGSVALSVSAGRRSRICTHETSSACRSPVRFLAPFITGCSSQRAFSPHRTTGDDVMSPHQGSCGGRGIAPLEAGVQPMQVSPCAQGLRVPLRPFPSRFLALPTCSFPHWVSPKGAVGCPRRSFALNLLLLWSYPMCAETAHYDVPYN